MRDALLIYRAREFSPNSVDKDCAILEAVGALLRSHGDSVRFVSEEALGTAGNADIILSMGRLPSTLAVLRQHESAGARVVNSAYGVERCARRCIDRLMRGNGIPAARAVDVTGIRDAACGGGSRTACDVITPCWLKRADMSAQSPYDVCYAGDMRELAAALDRFSLRGVTDVLVTEHVAGDLVKFYGVAGTPFFRVFYPTDDGVTKFGDEKHNGAARHYRFDMGRLHVDAGRLAALAGVQVYGGDCVVRRDGSYAIIDFNDWPSFSRCRDGAAEAIASLVM